MKFSYHIKGMHCPACVEKINSALSPKVMVVEVTYNPPLLTIEAPKPPSLNELNKYIAMAGNYQLRAIADNRTGADSEVVSSEVVSDEKTSSGLGAYYPILLIAMYIFGVSVINNVHWHGMNWQGWMSQFMAGFFLVFSAFKFLDLRGFADGYASYDLLAGRWYTYGFIYPFLELGLGVLYLTNWFPVSTQVLTIVIMGFSSIGVIHSLLKKQKITCACLGTVLKVPLSTVTLAEDLAMVILAALSLIITGSQ
jgi:cation transport ATPase